ncbi:MAG: ATPase [Bryobacterales bacterium]|nr:ATPase [Bryobacterales bacterium]
MALFLGVDGGQSSTTALVGDETGRVLGLGQDGPCNHVSGPEKRAKFLGAIGGAVSKALTAAGLDPVGREFAAACFGFSGGPQDKQPLIEEMFTVRTLSVTTDALIALVGATSGEPGLITIAGTGSIALGRNAEGKIARAGGWGYVFGDEGGGFDIVRQALRAALRQEEGWGPQTSLHSRLLEATGAGNANDLLHRFYTIDWPRPQIAALSKIVDQAALEGDPVAAAILNRAAQELATIAAAVRAQLFAPHETPRTAFIGGVFRSGFVRERFALLAGDRCGPPDLNPAAGALLEAYRIGKLVVKLANVPAVEK